MRDTEAVGEWYTDENIASGMRLECTKEILSALDDIRQARGRKVENEAARDVIAILFHQMAVDELAADLGGMLRERGLVYMERPDYERLKRAAELLDQVNTAEQFEYLKDEIQAWRASGKP